MNDYHDLSSLADELMEYHDGKDGATMATLEAAVDQLNILVFGVDHRASDKVNTDLAEVYGKALEEVYLEAWNSQYPYILRILQNVPGLIPEKEEREVKDLIKEQVSQEEHLSQFQEEHLSQLEIDERIERALERPFEEVLDELLGN
jgi:hypothetical protein